MKHIGGAITSYVILTAFFFILIGLLPANQAAMQAYNISASQYHILLFLVELPLAFVWFAAFYGYAKLEQYAISIEGTPEASGYKRLGRGAKWLAWGLPLPALLSLVLAAIANDHSGTVAAFTIVDNYFNLLFPVIAFSVMSEASRELVTHAKLRVTFMDAKYIQLLFVIIGVLFCYSTFRHLDLGTIGSSNNPYFLPVWLFVITIIVPYLYAWFIGLLTAYNIYLLARHSRGILYRQALRFMTGGLVIVIGSLIVVQYLHSVLPRSGHLSLNATLVIIYIIYLFTVIGFTLLALGASKLKKIEEV